MRVPGKTVCAFESARSQRELSHPADSFPKDQAGRAFSQTSGTISYLSCSLLRQLHMVRLVLRVRERGERNPTQGCSNFFRRIFQAKIATVKKLLL